MTAEALDRVREGSRGEKRQLSRTIISVGTVSGKWGPTAHVAKGACG